ncbi:bacteriophage N4 adsorption protein B [Symmachiella dynata]|uniref:GspE/PulE/PilB domain-containing protein n=1 Tax=Symmachiella dynata TaxID=2527995 RepID=UPI00118AA8C6|nr:hypothetical protein [Symmachiella dynata]QDT49451.1 bacteriophage N4 adsorption protein B [Symmachiella dynata]
MEISSRTPEGDDNRCVICGKPVVIEPSQPPGDAPCPHCGCLLWFGANSSLLGGSGKISAEQLVEAKSMAARTGIRVDEALVALGYVTADDIGQVQASEHGYEWVDIEDLQIPIQVIELVPASVARENTVIPLALESEALIIAIHDPMTNEVLEKLRFILDRDIHLVQAAPRIIHAAIEKHYLDRGEPDSCWSIWVE